MKKRKGWLTIHRSLGIAGIALVLVDLIVVIMASSSFQIYLI
jgi:hypothetical protein